MNTGGEAHTFTQVPVFAGGCVTPFNNIFQFTENPLCAGEFA